MAVELTDGKKKAETAATMTKLSMKAPNRLFFLLYLSMWTMIDYWSTVSCYLRGWYRRGINQAVFGEAYITSISLVQCCWCQQQRDAFCFCGGERFCGGRKRREREKEKRED